MARKTLAAARPVRMARLFFGRSELRRSHDRVEALIVALLIAIFIGALAAAPYFGFRLYQNERLATAHLHRVTAKLLGDGPSEGTLSEGTVMARWREPDGQSRQGMLTTLTAPAISGAPAGTRVQVWLAGSGRPVQPPASIADDVLSAITMTMGAVIGAAIALLTCYWLSRISLDRRRSATWASEWARIGPKWTTHR